MASQQLTNQLIKHLRDGVAMEQNVVRMLDSMLRTIDDPAIQRALEQHKTTSQQHAERLQERLKAHGASPSRVKQGAGILGAQGKRVIDIARREKAGRSARDAFATEHMEVASYHLLERVAQRADDQETVEVARQNRAEDEAMAKNIAGRWDTFAQLSLPAEGDGQADGGGVAQRAKQVGQRIGQFGQNPLLLGLGAVGVGLLIGRRAQGGGSQAAQQRPEEEPLELLSKAELQERAKAVGITVRRDMTKQDLVDALRASPQRGSAAKANPIEVQKFLQGVSYPTARQTLVTEAERQGADERIRATLRRLPTRTFDSATEVSEEIGRLE